MYEMVRASGTISRRWGGVFNANAIGSSVNGLLFTTCSLAQFGPIMPEISVTERFESRGRGQRSVKTSSRSRAGGSLCQPRAQVA